MIIKISRQIIISFLIVSVLIFTFASSSHAQEDNSEEVAKKHGISFPIAELGNCGNISACKSFCDSESNRDVCTNFAKKKGFYKQKQDNRQGSSENDELINSAKSALGCESEISCRAVCEKEENIEKCSSFAQKHNLGGSPRGKSGGRNVLQKAKEILGCDGEASCKAICEDPANQEKCSNFAKETGLGGGIRKAGPGGCNSEESCKKFCENNTEECRKFGGSPEGADGGRRGPGGCNSEESCRSYCESHPEECSKLGGSEPQEFQEKFCKENPDKCSGSGFRERNDLPNTSPEDFCKQNPDKCERPKESFRRPDESFRKHENFENKELNREFAPPQTPTFNRPVESGEQRNEQPKTENKAPVYQTPPVQPLGEEPTSDVRGASTSSSLLQHILTWFKTI